MRTRSNADKLIDRYLSHLDHALGDLPASRREQISEEIASHITEGRSSLDDENESSILALLDRVGDPGAIAQEAGVAPLSERSADAWVPWLLLFGGFAFGVGWFIGVGLLWSSRVWSVRDKLLGTFVLPGGLFGLVLLSGWLLAAPSALGIMVLLIVLGAPIVMAIHLEQVRRKS
jgi:hypothetical protein